ncbi:MAG: hypothetical protein BWY99_01699 [Synergistetes bacterium ADurb.BinA166]|nr:MAG: hypothetical protein BWY99_01699 [Synergistetes bacterium ADurb.BinA166]
MPGPPASTGPSPGTSTDPGVSDSSPSGGRASSASSFGLGLGLGLGSRTVLPPASSVDGMPALVRPGISDLPISRLASPFWPESSLPSPSSAGSSSPSSPLSTPSPRSPSFGGPPGSGFSSSSSSAALRAVHTTSAESSSSTPAPFSSRTSIRFRPKRSGTRSSTRPSFTGAPVHGPSRTRQAAAATSGPHLTFRAVQRSPVSEPVKGSRISAFGGCASTVTFADVSVMLPLPSTARSDRTCSPGCSKPVAVNSPPAPRVIRVHSPWSILASTLATLTSSAALAERFSRELSSLSPSRGDISSRVGLCASPSASAHM